MFRLKVRIYCLFQNESDDSYNNEFIGILKQFKFVCAGREITMV